MRFVRKFNSFISEERTMAEPLVKPDKREIQIRPDKDRSTKPMPPQVIPDRRQSPVPAPAKAELETATAEDVVERFIQLINQSGDDIKKYVEIR